MNKIRVFIQLCVGKIPPSLLYKRGEKKARGNSPLNKGGLEGILKVSGIMIIREDPYSA
ncbi:hypothetical protein Desti_0810 [Desulfomonile tiedjei DSM 6799]|uniref:Uncharacterized protein n=1 Tax=Desulfomonile tiedjei (strain ATCC 49306 / DSM 6799 / DCB-1) TaxID=706587 RepID=I4C1U3_DESTA|nr:hypothetical protein Desti_0810 [Desulfomonile tiedjei DSM 6799]